jgi:heme/copper-type cytochrome/quinol oxidase subunit 2
MSTFTIPSWMFLLIIWIIFCVINFILLRKFGEKATPEDNSMSASIIFGMFLPLINIVGFLVLIMTSLERIKWYKILNKITKK